MTKTNDLKDAIRINDGKPLPILENHYPGIREYNYMPWHPGSAVCCPDEFTVAIWHIKPHAEVEGGSYAD